MDLGVQIDSVKQPIQRNSVGSGHVSHCWTSALYDHFHHSFVVFISVQLRLTLRRVCVSVYVVHMRQLINVSVSLLFGSRCAIPFGISQTVSCCGAWSLVIWYCSMNVTLLSPHPIRSSGGNSSILSPASN